MGGGFRSLTGIPCLMLQIPADARMIISHAFWLRPGRKVVVAWRRAAGIIAKWPGAAFRPSRHTMQCTWGGGNDATCGVHPAYQQPDGGLVTGNADSAPGPHGK